MNAIHVLHEQIARIGYSAIVPDYVFSDVFAPLPTDRKVLFAAFTHTPPSYRNAAFAVVAAQQRSAADVVSEHRALGAPLLFVVEGENVTVWQVRTDLGPRAIARAHRDELPALFSANSADWSPQSIQRAKSIGAFNRHYQLDFVDLGLLPAIEGEIHAKLDRLLNEALAEAIDPRTSEPRGVNERSLFRAVFRFLAAKILQDREHSLASTWDPEKIETVLDAISKYYRLPLFQLGSTERRIFSLVWQHLRRGINFQNISADDLAFVYENTLVTPEIRKAFGTHSTPRPVAEYVVNRLEFWRHDPTDIRVYEPFAGAGIFLVAALRQLRELLRVDWTDKQRHEFLVQRITGDEFDPFAKEVATLSLILADYPNANGWAVTELDLFENNKIAQRARLGNVVLCNPPFESFTPDERSKYPEAAAHSAFKPIAVLDAVLDASPMALGFVLPEPFIKGAQYKAQRQRIEKLYKDVELVSLPDRTFKHSVIRSSLIIARDLREAESHTSAVRSTVVTVQGRDQFLRGGEVSDTRLVTRSSVRGNGDLWINELEGVWESLASNPTLESAASVHRGLQWHDGQTAAVRNTPHKGFVKGIHAANAVKAFALEEPKYLDYRPNNIRRAGNLPWTEAKILANAARLSRGPWCLAAAIDNEGFIFSQQLFGIWPKQATRLHTLCALLNSPVANAYIASHSPADRIRVSAVLSIPIPSTIPPELEELAKRYARVVAQGEGLFSQKRTEQADKVLNQIDAVILKAYDLPPRLEKKLLEYFRGWGRPTSHEWSHWFPAGFTPFIPLHEYFSAEYQRARKDYLLRVFTPLPNDEAVALREILD
jgi:type I restriction-modification system DNA methylase subunit